MLDFKKIALCALMLGASQMASAITQDWVAQGNNNNLNSAGNWNPPGVPTAGDTAVFNSTSPAGVNTTPTASADFTADAFQFVGNAQAFQFSIPNAELTFSGAGITAISIPTNTTINATNTNNSADLNAQVYFSSIGSASSGQAEINAVNSGQNGMSSNLTQGQVLLSNSTTGGYFYIGDGGSISASNSGTSTSGSSQIIASFPETPSQAQIISYGTLSGGDNVSFSASNIGTENNTSGISSSNEISNFYSQITTHSLSLGDAAVFNLSNSGTNNDTGAGGGHIISDLVYQLLFGGNAVAGDDLSITLNAQATDNSANATGNTIGYIDYQLGTDSLIVGDNATISINLEATNNNTNASSAGGQSLGYTSYSYLGPLTAGSDFTLEVTNTGTDNGATRGKGGGVTANKIAYNDDDMLYLGGLIQLGNNASITVSNTGVNKNSNAGVDGGGNYIGYVDSEQWYLDGGLITGDNFCFTVSNSGEDAQSPNSGGNHVGYVGQTSVDAFQAYFDGSISTGKNALVNISNSGVNNNISTTGGGQVIGGVNYTQLGVVDLATFGDNSALIISNEGIDNSANATANFVGYVGEYQTYFYDLVLGDGASITVTNTGTNNNTSVAAGSGGHEIGLIDAEEQLDLYEEYAVWGDNVTVTVSNSGTDNSRNPVANYVGYVNTNQFDAYEETLVVGDNVAFNISNIGTNNNTAATGSYVGYVGTYQCYFYDAPFSAGDNLTLNVSNTSINNGANTNIVGYVGAQLVATSNFTTGDNASIVVTNNGGTVGASQIKFEGAFSTGNNSSITAVNTGSISGPQMLFSSGFTVGNAATLAAIHSGSGSNQGIVFTGASSGGDARIVLQNSSLEVAPTLAAFTIGGITGDVNSTASIAVPLTIATDAGYTASFAGPIEATVSGIGLTKTGAGTQILSGDNTYTGDTLIQEGTLVLAAPGSLAGNVQVFADGLLAGSGTIDGSVVNAGVVMPGQSIGTLTTGNYTQLSSGTYLDQVNGAGQSSQLDINGPALLAGTLAIISADGTYAINETYRLLTASGGLSGTTFQTVVANPLLVPIVTYGADYVDLLLRTDFTSAAFTKNQRRIAEQIDRNGDPNADEAFVIDNLLALTPAQIPGVLNQLTGAQYTYLIEDAQYSDRRFGRRIFDMARDNLSPCASLCGCDGRSAWIDTEAGTTYAKDSKRAHKERTYTFDISVGAHTALKQCAFAGLAANYETGRLDFGGHRSKGHQQTGQGALYAGYVSDCIYLFSDLVLGYSQADINRPIHFAAVGRKARGKARAFHGNWYGEIGYNYVWNCALLQPFFGVDAEFFHQYSMKESHADSLNLHLNARSTANYNTYLGSHFTYTLPFTCPISLNLDLAWQHRFGASPAIDARFVQFGSRFNIDGNNPGTDGLWGNINAEAELGESFSVYGEFTGEWWNRFSAYSFNAGLSYNW